MAARVSERRPNVTAKVKVGMVVEQSNGDVALHFYPDYDDGRNKEWSTATPSLYYQMLVKPSVAEHFPMGKAFTVTFTPEG